MADLLLDMKVLKKTLLVGCVMLAGASVRAEDPEVVWSNTNGVYENEVTHYEFESPSMDRLIGYNVFLPTGYEDSGLSYPVLYFLHGSGGSEVSDADSIAGMLKARIEAGEIPPIIGVFPNGGDSGYNDHPETKVMVRTMIVDELVPLIDRRFRTVASRDSRVMLGFSMGGQGAIRFALERPDLFCAAGAWAAAFSKERHQALQVPAKPQDGWDTNLLVELYFVIGIEDFLYSNHRKAIQKLVDSDYPYRLQTLHGVDHDFGAYQRLTADEMILFLNKSLTNHSTLK